MGRIEDRDEDKDEHRKERIIDNELSKTMFIEVCTLIETKFDEYISRLKIEFATKDEHSTMSKVMWTIGVISVVSLGLSMMALGMKVEDALLRIVGAK